MLRCVWFTSPVGAFVSVAAPGAISSGPRHVVFHAWLGGWSGQLPILNIDGWNISLAGLVLPLLLAMILLRGMRVSDLPRSAIAALSATLACNLFLVAQQSDRGFPGGGVHLCTLVPVLLLLDTLRVAWLKRRPEYLADPRMLRTLAGLSLTSMLPADAFGSMLMAWQSGADPLHGLQWVGGAGWHDGLLWGVLLTAGSCAFVWLVQRFTRLRATVGGGA